MIDLYKNAVYNRCVKTGRGSRCKNYPRLLTKDSQGVKLEGDIQRKPGQSRSNPKCQWFSHKEVAVESYSSVSITTECEGTNTHSFMVLC